jgi:hypothetical protein
MFGKNGPFPEAIQLPLPAAPRMVPLSEAAVEVLQTVGVVATATVATGTIFTCTVLLSEAHAPLEVDVSV